MASEEKPLEGHSLGRNEDSILYSNGGDDTKQADGQKEKLYDISKGVPEDKEARVVDEEEVLEITESIFTKLAEKLITSMWTVKDVFGHPKLIEEIPKFDGKENVKTLTPNNFLGRLF